MKLKLTRPIAFLDIESTGTNRETDRIIDLCICKLLPEGITEPYLCFRLNPTIPIPAGATAVHGIKDEDVVGHSTFAQLAGDIEAALEGCDIGGFGSNSFDVPLLYNEFARAGIDWDYTKFKMIDAGAIFKIQEARTLTAALKFYCDRDHEGAHGAEADTMATIDVFLSQMERYDLPDNVDALALFCNYGKQVLDLSGKFGHNEAGEVVFNFGPHRGQPANNHLDFVQWMTMKDFSRDTMEVCEQLLMGRFQVGTPDPTGDNLNF